MNNPNELCCGGTRERIGCTYHDPSLQPLTTMKKIEVGVHGDSVNITEGAAYELQRKKTAAHHHRSQAKKWRNALACAGLFGISPDRAEAIATKHEALAKMYESGWKVSL